MSGTTQVDQELDQGFAKLAKFPRKFVNTCLAFGIAFAVEKARTTFGERKENGLKGGSKAASFLLGVHAGARGTSQGQCRAEHLRSFFRAEDAREFFEIRDAIGAIEEHVDGETDAHESRVQDL